ncbi:hypothetical protein PSTG_19141, partial [Puccinia striiformis f. sp. tritici PST-78]
MAAVQPASSIPTIAPEEERNPEEHTRLCDEGVCVDDTLTLPRCEYIKQSPHPILDPVGNPPSLLECNRIGEINTAKASWSTSAQLAAGGKANTPARTAEELVPTQYHKYIDMFKKTGAQRLPPRRKYDFR